MITRRKSGNWNSGGAAFSGEKAASHSFTAPVIADT